MISITDEDLNTLLANCYLKTFESKEFLLFPNKICNEIFFINYGLTRTIITDDRGTDHTIHFALESQFITDYSSFLLKRYSSYGMQALEKTEVIVMPRSSVEWGYQYLPQGDRLGRLIAEFYFTYHDAHIRNLYVTDPVERYQKLDELFPNIQNRVPQHMIASYLGITPVHLSRLKKMPTKNL